MLAGTAWTYDDGDVTAQISATYDLGTGTEMGFEIGYYEGYDTTFAVTVGREIGNGFDVNFRALATPDEGFILTLGVSRDIGNGAKFRRPDYLALFNVW